MLIYVQKWHCFKSSQIVMKISINDQQNKFCLLFYPVLERAFDYKSCLVLCLPVEIQIIDFRNQLDKLIPKMSGF
jgi:hypothetical protein